MLRYLVDHQVQLPCRARSGAATGELECTARIATRSPRCCATRSTRGLTPRPPRRRRAAGAGHTGNGRAVAGRRRAGQGSVAGVHQLGKLQQTRREWQPTAVSTRGSPSAVRRSGWAVVCGRCGQRMVTQYPSRGRFLRYSCTRQAVNYGAGACQSLSGRALDALVAGLMLEVLQPAALEVNLRLLEDLELERAALHRQWQQRLERARYEAGRARRSMMPLSRRPAGCPHAGAALGGGAVGGASPQGRLRSLSGRSTRSLTPAEQVAIAASPRISGALDRPDHHSRRSSDDRAPNAGARHRHRGRHKRQVAVVCDWPAVSRPITACAVRWRAFRSSVPIPRCGSGLPSYMPWARGRGDCRGVDAEGWKPAKRRETFTAAMIATSCISKGCRWRRDCHGRPGPPIGSRRN